MKYHHLFLPMLALAFLLSSCSKETKKSEAETSTKTQRIVSLNGAISEIVYDLGHGKELVGRDVTSTYPAYVRDSVKDLGHVRSIGMEAIMALRPTLILASKNDMNPKLEEKIKASGISYQLFDQKFSVEGTKNLIKEVSQFLGSNNTQPLMDKIDADIAKVKPLAHQPKVLFIYARGAGTMLVAGEGTPMVDMIRLAGGENAVKGITDFKPLTQEALVNSNPDVLLLFNSGLESLGGKEGIIKAIPALSQTNAGKNQAIITMEGGLLSDFGPRVGKAAYELNQLLAPYAK